MNASEPTSSSSVDLDPLFQQGLQSILAPLYARNASPEEIADVTARATQFYAQSKASAPPPPPPSAAAPAPEAAPIPSPAASSAEPPYPMSFAHLASLIASGAPIPGIRDIPDKLAEGEPSVSQVSVKRKPWETAAPSEGEDAGAGEGESQDKVMEEGTGQV
ncbi:hypothetical protein RQP46_000624 [Phenoliferia psychrophenolica]